jgi:hypothetical protein
MDYYLLLRSSTKLSEEHGPSIFRAEECTEPDMSMKQAASREPNYTALYRVR